ncbi:hypothetical protein NQ318_022434 [Aromia moschata]|uniref:Protein quiver n=1 Tax=Aromia moschata TaxID=1265417 RepID=A0AAV8Z5B1_9CUCU|nr:hypothetical protein NQ318_022434 [Aromia moschata]
MSPKFFSVANRNSSEAPKSDMLRVAFWAENGLNYESTVRECAMVDFDNDVTTCHVPVDSGFTLISCHYCEYDRCNSSTGLKTNILLAGALAVASVLFLRY